MFRSRNANQMARATADSVVRTALILAFGIALAFSTSAFAQSGGKSPAVDGVQKVQPGQCTGNNSIRYYFLYDNGDFDSGISTSQEINDTNLNCVTFQDGDTDLDAEFLHLSCSLDYNTDPTAVGNGLTVVEWHIYRLNTSGGVCGTPESFGHLVIAKETIPNGDTTSFSFNSPQATIGAFSLQDGQSANFDLIPGSYSVTETEPSGWNLTGLVCDDPTSNSTGDTGTATASINLAADETVTCTFTNTAEETPTFDLSIVKSDGGQLLVPEGGIVVYTLSYMNTGNVDLTGVTITEHVPTNTTFSAADSTNGWSCADGAAAGTACTFNVGAVPQGGSGQVLFGLKVDEIWFPDPQTGQCPSNPGPLVVDNTASIVDDGNNGADSNTSNNQDSDDTPISLECESLVQTPSIVITKNPASQLIQLGANANFTIKVTNNGDVDLINVMVTDPLSPDCNHNIGNLAVGASVTYTCSKSNVQGNFTNVATACGDVQEGGNVCDDDNADVRVLTEEEPPQTTAIPTLSAWALILVAGLMLLLGGRRVKEWTRR